MHSEAHDTLVSETLARYLHLGAQAKKFGAALRGALRRDFMSEPDADAGDVEWILADFHEEVPQPDVFAIDHERKEILCLECTVSSGVAPKLVRYGELWFDLDCYDWTLRLVEVFRGGHETEVDLFQAWFDRCLPPRVAEMRKESPEL